MFEQQDILEQILVIDGQLTSSPGPHHVRISRTRNFGEKFSELILGAEVNLVTPSAVYNYTETTEGAYVLNNFKGIIGEEYSLEVTMPSGSFYKSAPAIMPQAVKADSAYHEFQEDLVISSTGVERLAPVINVFVDTPIPSADPDKESYLRWFTDELYIFPEEGCGGLHAPKTCYVSISGNPQNIAIFNSRNLADDKLLGLNVARKTHMPNFHFKAALFFNVYQYVIDKDAYTYWSKLKSLTGQSGTVFDLPPASVQGNIENMADPNEQVLGYFEVATVDTIRTRVLSSEYKQKVNGIVFCSQFDRRNWPDECCQCLVLDNASTIRPAWLD